MVSFHFYLVSAGSGHARLIGKSLLSLLGHSVRGVIQHYLHSPPHKNQTLHERERKTAHFKAAGKPPLATCQASAKPSCLSEHAHLKPTACYYGNSVGSLEVWTAILIAECKKPNAAEESRERASMYSSSRPSLVPAFQKCTFVHFNKQKQPTFPGLIFSCSNRSSFSVNSCSLFCLSTTQITLEYLSQFTKHWWINRQTPCEQPR